MAAKVYAANIHDNVGAMSVVERLAYKFPRLRKLLADGGYRGEELRERIRKTFGWELTVVLCPNDCPKRFNVIPKRCIVEKSFTCYRTSKGLRLTVNSIPNPLKL